MIVEEFLPKSLFTLEVMAENQFPALSDGSMHACFELWLLYWFSESAVIGKNENKTSNEENRQICTEHVHWIAKKNILIAPVGSPAESKTELPVKWWKTPQLRDSLAPKCMPLVIRRDYALHYYGFIDFPSLLWFITINLDDFVSSLKFNPLLLTRLFSLTRMLFKSQQISFMLTLRSKVIHPRLKNLPKRDRNQLDLKKKIYIYIKI